HIDDVIYPFGGMTDAERADVADAVEQAKDSVCGGCMAPAPYANLRNTLAALADEKARDALQNDLYRAAKIAYVIKRQAF
ncbi:MAG: hypothetical protein IJC52_04365, partial [Clostridia bacterium]|nr:hypothetical protein [Clostridia bacterium]